MNLRAYLLVLCCALGAGCSREAASPTEIAVLVETNFVQGGQHHARFFITNTTDHAYRYSTYDGTPICLVQYRKGGRWDGNMTVTLRCGNGFGEQTLAPRQSLRYDRTFESTQPVRLGIGARRIDSTNGIMHWSERISPP